MTAAHPTNNARAESVRTYCDARLNKLMNKYKQISRTPADTVETEMKRTIGEDSRGGQLVSIFNIIRAAMGKRGGDNSKLTEVYLNDDRAAGKIAATPAAVREAARDIGANRLAETKVNMPAVKRMLEKYWPAPTGTTPPTRTAPTSTRALDKACSWASFQRALSKCSKDKATGYDGFNAYLVRKAPKTVQQQYHNAISGMIRTREFPAAYHHWIASLAMKKDEDPRELGRRRDLWTSTHGQKIIMRMLQPEYDRAARQSVPASQAGWENGRGAPEQTLALHLAAEDAMEREGVHCCLYLDMSSFFMGVVRDVMYAVEEVAGVDRNITDVVKALHGNVQGAYETEYGLTAWFRILCGTGQGCVNGAVRAKLMLVILQKVITRLCRGTDVTKGRGAVPQVWYADDGCLVTSSIAALQHAVDCAWFVTKICGLKLQVKQTGTKTAYMATCWDKGVEKDILGADVRLPDGTPIPQIRGMETYTHLGTKLQSGHTHRYTQARDKLTETCKSIISTIGRIPMLDVERFDKITQLAVTGHVGYVGRNTPLTWEASEQIEQTRLRALMRRKLCPGKPKLQAYTDKGGLNHEHTYAAAAAAYVDQIDRILCGGEGEPARNLLEASIARTAWRLGCRQESPITWLPTYMEDELDDNIVVEAWLKIKIRADLRAHIVPRYHSPLLRRAEWTPSTEAYITNGPGLWESAKEGPWATVDPIPYTSAAKRLTALGITCWNDITHDVTGDWLTTSQLQERYGPSVTPADNAAYDWLRACLDELDWGGDDGQQTVLEWQRAVRARGATALSTYVSDTEARNAHMWSITNVLAARTAPAVSGGWEYYVQWRHGTATWETANQLAVQSTGGMAADLEQARNERRIPFSLYERLHLMSTAPTRSTRTRAQKLTEAISAPIGALTNHQAKNLYDWCEDHLSNVPWNTWGDGRQENMAEPPAAIGEPGIKWECMENTRTLYLGGREKVQVLDGTTLVEEERDAVGLDHARPWEEELPPCHTVTTDETTKRIQDARSRDDVPEDLPQGEPWIELTYDKDDRSDSIWRHASDPEGYDVDDHGQCADPLTRLLMRSAALEDMSHIKVTTATGRPCKCDKDEQSHIREGGTTETRKWLRAAMALHVRHSFTHAAATDGSKKGNKVAYGIWRGTRAATPGEPPIDANNPRNAQHRREMKVSHGLTGGRLPDDWEVADAEMYAIYELLRQISSEEEAPPSTQRILVTVDNKSVLMQIENAWRRERTAGLRTRQRAAMLEAICRWRSHFGLVVFLWCPSHRGVTCNAYADAAAKAHLDAPHDPALAQRLTGDMRARPCIYWTENRPIPDRPLFGMTRQLIQQ